MNTIRKLLLENKAWAKGHNEIDPHYFENMSIDQNPEILWIGCADSRVVPDEIINARPGSLFVHRNIANIVYADDENLMSVLEYAVKFLKVKYIIVCGHYNCGGVRAAFEGIENPKLKNWTRSISEIKFEKKPDSVNSLVELSVKSQISKLADILGVSFPQKAEEYPKILGWVYDISTGLINEMKV